MKLMTTELRNILPKLYETEQEGDKALVRAHYFQVQSNWHWYAVEFDGKDLFFGLVVGFEIEQGYFSLSELASVGDPKKLIVPVERDLYWDEQTVGEVKAAWQKQREGA